MKAYARDQLKVGMKEVNGVLLPLKTMTIHCNGPYSQAKNQVRDEYGNLSFHDGCFNDIAIAQGSAFLNTLDGSVLFYDEENDRFGA